MTLVLEAEALRSRLLHAETEAHSRNETARAMRCARIRQEVILRIIRRTNTYCQQEAQ